MLLAAERIDTILLQNVERVGDEAYENMRRELSIAKEALGVPAVCLDVVHTR